MNLQTNGLMARFRRRIAILSVLLVSGPAVAQEPAPPAPPPPPTIELVDGYFPEPRPLTRAVERFNKLTGRIEGRAPTNGFFAELGGMITGSGWLSAGPGYRHSIANGKGRISASGGVSVRLYTMAQAELEFPSVVKGITLGAHAQYRDSPQINYFGLGNNTVNDDRTGYDLETMQVAGFAATRRGIFDLRGRAGVLPFVRVSEMHGRIPQFPNTQALFGDSLAPGINHSTSYVFADAAAAIDTRETEDYPLRGGRYELRWAAYSDRERARYSFQRFEVEVTQHIPLTPRWGLAAAGWVVGTAAGKGQLVPFYLLPSLGGRNTVRGYEDFRFHDRAATFMSIESRWGIWRHLDAAVFYDAGKVARRVSDLGLNDLKQSVGVGIRLHNNRTTITRLDFAYSNEGWQTAFKFSPSFQRSRPDSGRPAAVPFVP